MGEDVLVTRRGQAVMRLTAAPPVRFDVSHRPPPTANENPPEGALEAAHASTDAADDWIAWRA
jgi:antitoxin (DNA-binding transcriptional repressor) of toxin-antitoxin stability system